VESCGYAVWFHRLVEETGHQLKVGDARGIRQFAKRRQKNDRRDAALLLELFASRIQLRGIPVSVSRLIRLLRAFRTTGEGNAS
jgi:transposase